MATYRITLTGVQATVSLNDLGIRPIDYNPPASDNIDLIASYGLSVEEINESQNFISALNNGYITAETPDGTIINSGNVGDIVESQNSMSVRRNNLDATTNPTVNDDSSQGYTVGSIWVNVNTDATFQCVDNTNGNAVWVVESNETLDWSSILNKPTEFPPEDHTASKITDFDIEVSNNIDVSSNTTHRGLTNNPHNTNASQVGINDTDDINEGSNNLYYTEARVSDNSDVSDNTDHRNNFTNPHNTTASQVGIDDTDDINEGSNNLYYTETRVNNNTNVSQNTTHRGLTNNPHSVNKTQIGLGNVTNDAQIPLSQKGAINGVASLDGTGKIPSPQLPSFVDDVQEYANLASFPATGTASIIYVTLDTNKTYRWSGTSYVEISTGAVDSVNGQTGVVSLDTDDISEGSNNLYYTETRVSNNTDVSQNTTHRGLTNNPHNTTASQVGIDDTDDISEGSNNLYYTEDRVSNNVDVSANTTHRGLTNNPHTVTKSQIGLGNVTNDAQIPLSQKGAANGVASLDGTGKVPLTQLPASALVDELNELTDVQITNPQNGEVLTRDAGVWKNLPLSGETGNSTKQINQVSHGFTLVDNTPIPAYINGSGLWQKAIANDAEKLHSSFVVEVIDSDNFVIQQSGYVNAPSHRLSVGDYYYLSDTTLGDVTNNQPTAGLDDVCFHIIDSDTILLIDNRPFDRNSLEKWIIVCSNTDTTTNLNTASFQEIPITGNVELNENNYYTVVGNGIQVPESRSYKLRANIHVEGDSQRQNLRVRFFVNGNPVGPISASGYIRDANGHNESSFSLEYTKYLSVNDVITVRSEQEGNSRDVEMAEIGTSTFEVEAR